MYAILNPYCICILYRAFKYHINRINRNYSNINEVSTYLYGYTYYAAYIHSIDYTVKCDYFNYITSYDVLCITLTCCSITGEIIHLSTLNIIENYYLIITKLNFRISSRIGFISDVVKINYLF